MAKGRRGFTISELLVVIIIMAVVGAILAPILVQVRSSAKRTTCANNLKQIFMGTTSYAIDYDDFVMPVAYQPTKSTDSRTDRTWVQLVLPYVRSFAVFRCPADDTQNSTFDASFDKDLIAGDTYSQFYTASMRVDYGYNSQYFAPVELAGSGPVQTTRTLTEVAKPSGTLIFTESVYDRDEDGQPQGGGSWLVVPPCRYAPDGRSRRQVVDTFSNRVGFGLDMFTTSKGWASNDSSSGQVFGGTWPWHSGRMNVGFVDGHVKALRPVDLTAGCDLRPEWFGLINNSQAYLWNLN